MNGKFARLFMEELWNHLISAMESDDGIPEELINIKKEEIRRRVVRIFEPLNAIFLNFC